MKYISTLKNMTIEEYLTEKSINNELYKKVISQNFYANRDIIYKFQTSLKKILSLHKE